MAFEALNHASEVDADMLVILNDNDMSISHNVGGLSNYLAKILSSRTYSSMREGSKKVLSRLPGPGRSPGAPRNTPRACWSPAPCSRSSAGTT